MKRTLIAAALFAASAGLSVAHAQGYVGASIGQSEVQEDCVAGASCDFKDTGWKVFGGYMFLPYVGIEGAYVDLGKATVRDAIGTTEVKTNGFGLWAKGAVPIQNFAVFAKLGFAYLDTELSETGFATESESNTGFAWGVGAAYHFNQNLGVRVEFERFRPEFQGEKFDVDLLSAGIVYRF